MGKEDSLDLKLREVRELEALHTDHQKMMYGRNSAQKRKIRLQKIILERCQGLDVLDMGCAEGDYGHFFLEAGAKSVLGMDLSPTKIERAKHRFAGKSRCEFLAGGLEEMAQLNRKFDFILCTEVLQHIPNYLEFVNKLCDHLNLGGYFLYTVPYFSISGDNRRTNFNADESSENLLKIIGGAGLGRTAGIWKFNIHTLNREIIQSTGMTLEQTINVKRHFLNAVSLIILLLSRKLFSTDLINPYPVILFKKTT